jgi:transcription factor C subunit 3
LARSERNPPPSHLLDLHIVGIMETSGRERHHRYYTIRHYRQFVNEESLDNESAVYNNMDLSDVGGFSTVDPNAFYETEGDTVRYTSSFRSKLDLLEKKKKNRAYKNPILPDGTVEKGRPRKKPKDSEAIDINANIKPRKRKYAESEEEESKRPSKKIRISEISPDPPTREC